MEYDSRDFAEIIRTYGEISVYSERISRGIEPEENTQNCLIAIGNYRRFTPKLLIDEMGTNFRSLELRCKDILKSAA